MRTYRRRLPHLDAPGDPVFVTWRLWGSLPRERIFQPEHFTSGEAFVAWDRLLDTSKTGPFYLRRPDVASLVKEHLDAAVADGLCELHAYVVMPNHVHLLCSAARESGSGKRNTSIGWFAETVNSTASGATSSGIRESGPRDEPRRIPLVQCVAGLKPHAG